jgi:hypothetical protein
MKLNARGVSVEARQLIPVFYAPLSREKNA